MKEQRQESRDEALPVLGLLSSFPSMSDQVLPILVTTQVRGTYDPLGLSQSKSAGSRHSGTLAKLTQRTNTQLI